MIQQAWTQGGNPKTLMVGALGKQVTSGFSGIAEKIMQQTSPEVTAIIGAADAYVSDFGTSKLLCRTALCTFARRSGSRLGFHSGRLSASVLAQEPLARLVTREKRMLIAEYGLLREEREGALTAADLTP